jgi:DNA-binding NarL/FixJ family response regulator
MEKIKVLIVDDHVVVRQGLRTFLELHEDIEIVGEAEDGQKAIQQANSLQPNLVLMDLTMPRMNGTDAIRAIKRRNPETNIIVLTVHKAAEYVRSSLEAGASGYVLKDDSHQDLLTAIRTVVAGRTYLSSGICDQIVSGFLGRTSASATELPWDTLTDREKAVIKLVAEGYKNREIAEFLNVSIKTVEKHRSNLMKKLDLHNASALTAYAIQNGLVGQ